MNDDKIAEWKQICARMPFADNDRGILETMQAMEEMIAEIKRLRAQLAASQARADGLAAYVKSLTECQCWAARDPSSMTADEFEKKAHAFERMIDLGSKAIGWLGDKP